MIFRKIRKWWNARKYYVLTDPRDNSITLSKHLFRHMRDNEDGGKEANVFVFKIPSEDSFNYGFMVNPDINTPTQLCQIQYNSKYKCIGFETLCPSVGRILFDYGLSAMNQVKFSISIDKTVNGKIFYVIDNPKKKSS